MLSIAKTIKRCAYMCILSCMIHVAPSWADICFLPTGDCERGATAKADEQKSCDEYVAMGRYYKTEQEGMSCSVVNISGCSLYECTGMSCENKGFKLGPTDSKTHLPLGYSSNAWICESCLEGADYFWKCLPKPCAGNYKTRSECAENETLIEPETPVNRSGIEICGVCVSNSELTCPEGSSSVIPTGCYECANVGDTGYGGNPCYKCKTMGSYQPESEFLATHDTSCYDFTTKSAADGELCYKGTKRTCGEKSDQYLSEEVVNGKTMCKCRDYTYEFTVNPSLLQFDASGGTKSVAVTSKHIGNEAEPWEYNVSLTACSCSASKSQSGDKVTVTCPPNKSENEAGCTMTLIQTHVDTTVDTKTVGIRIYKDSCESGQLSTVCADGNSVAQPNGKTSVSGQICYKCNNNNCGAGWIDGDAPASEGYDVKVLESGKTCHRAIEIPQDAETCPAGYSEAEQECMAGFKLTKTQRSDGSYCYKCVSEDCPAGKDCTDEPVCPNGNPCSGKVDCDSKPVGNGTKFFDCKCKPSAINCGAGFNVDKENCSCTSKDCEAGFDKGITSCEPGWKLEKSNSQAGDAVCARCVKETCPAGQICKPWIQCKDGTSCDPNPNIKCDPITLGAEKMYTNCKCKITASSCTEGQTFDDNRCECRDAGCPVGYDTKVTSCPEGYEFSKNGKSGNADCGKCTAKTCPSGQICTDTKVCPNSTSCANNPDVECQTIKLGDSTKLTNCRCTLIGKTKTGYTLDQGYCKWVKQECPSGTSTDVSAANCPTGDIGGYHIVETNNKSGDAVCKRCEANTCPAGKSCMSTPICPNGQSCTGNPYVSCQKIKLGASWAYYDCTCKISDQACGTGKKANTTACACEGCEGKLQSELNGAMTCDKITCNGQTRYKNCVPWGSQWQTTSNSSCNESKVSDDGRTYFDTSKVCQCDKGSASSNCSGQCMSTQKCVSSGSSTKDGSSCYQCKNDTCPSGQTKDPNDCVSISKTSGTQDPSSMYYTYKAAGTTDAGSTCYTCSSSCTPKACSGYTYAESEFIKNTTDNYEECDPGCGAEKKYKCKSGTTANKQPNGKTVCASSGSGTTGNKKVDCSKKYSSADGWEYLGEAYQGTQAANEYMKKYAWPKYKYEIGNCDSYMYGRKYNTVCNVYNYCNNNSTNRQCYNTTLVTSMESSGFCCATSGNKSDVYGEYGSVSSIEEYCCYQGQGCPVSKVGSSNPNQTPSTSKCPSGQAEVGKSNMPQYTKACGDNKRVPSCTSPSSTADYVCCTCSARPS